MTYDAWKLASPYEGERDERGWDDEDTRVDECVHGEHPIECSLCTSVGTIAAVSGEEEDMRQEDHPNPEEDGNFELQLRTLLEGATDLQVKQARYIQEREEKRRVDIAKTTIRTLDPDAPKQRATRKDAGKSREEYKATKGAA